MKTVILVLFIASVLMLGTLEEVKAGDASLGRKVDVGAARNEARNVITNKGSATTGSTEAEPLNSSTSDSSNSNENDNHEDNVLNRRYGRYARGGSNMGGGSSTDTRHRIYPVDDRSGPIGQPLH